MKPGGTKIMKHMLGIRAVTCCSTLLDPPSPPLDFDSSMMVGCVSVEGTILFFLGLLVDFSVCGSYLWFL